MNKKLLTVASVVALTLMAFAKSAKVQDDCVFCGGNVSYIEDDPAPVPSQKGDSTCIFCGEGGVSGGGSTTYYWSAATTRSVIFTDGEYYAGSATIKTGKYNKKKGTVAVSISFKMKNGKKYTAKETSVKPDEDWTLNASWSNVKGIGAVDISIGIDGSVEGTAGSYELSQEGVDIDDDDDGEVFHHGEHTFVVEVDDYDLDEKYDLLTETIPDGYEIVTSNSKKWNCGSAPKIKYQTIKEDGEKWYELTGLDDERKPNVSNLKLKYDSKKNKLSGSFTAYATNETSIEKGKPKLKSYSFKLNGQLSGSAFTGTAICKKLKANWTFVIE